MTTREAARSLQRYGGRARKRLRYRRATPPPTHAYPHPRAAAGFQARAYESCVDEGRWDAGVLMLPSEVIDLPAGLVPDNAEG
jgi:hypothetical protein